jgi:hypothetical protein
VNKFATAGLPILPLQDPMVAAYASVQLEDTPAEMITSPLSLGKRANNQEGECFCRTFRYSL